jgi:hypothetical protein
MGRPGRSEPDFVFYPRSPHPLGSFGIIELKRPNTLLVTKPRKDVIVLSRDVSTAVAQAQLYSRELRTKLAPRLTSNLILGANDHIFVIAGLSDELVTKLTPDMLHENLDALLPTRCQIIPYDQLLERFESSLHINILYFTAIQRGSVRELESLVALAARARGDEPISEGLLWKALRSGRTERWQINDETMDFWCMIEDRWRAGGYIGTSIPCVIDRPYWCVTGTDVLATESPAHLEFPQHVTCLVNYLKSSLRLHKILVEAQWVATPMDSLLRNLPERAANILTEAIQRCKASDQRTTYFEPADHDVQLLERLGLVRFSTIESSDAWYEIDPLLLHVWQ